MFKKKRINVTLILSKSLSPHAIQRVSHQEKSMPKEVLHKVSSNRKIVGTKSPRFRGLSLLKPPGVLCGDLRQQEALFIKCLHSSKASPKGAPRVQVKRDTFMPILECQEELLLGLLCTKFWLRSRSIFYAIFPAIIGHPKNFFEKDFRSKPELERQIELVQNNLVGGVGFDLKVLVQLRFP